MIKNITVTGLNESIAYLEGLSSGGIKESVGRGLLDWGDRVLVECIAETPLDTGALRSTEVVFLEEHPSKDRAVLAFQAGGQTSQGPWKAIAPIGKSGRLAPDFVDYAAEVHEDLSVDHPVHAGKFGQYDCEGNAKFLEGPILRNLGSLDEAIWEHLFQRHITEWWNRQP